MMARRYLAFTREDEKAYCDLLVARWPNIRFVPQLSYDDRKDKSRRPPEQAFKHISDCPKGQPGRDPFDVVDIYFTWPTWRPAHEWSEKYESWIFGSANTEPNGVWKPATMSEKWRGTWPPHVHTKQIYFRAYTPEAEKTVRAALRLVSKVATNKLVMVYPGDQDKRRVPQSPPMIVWAGHHAIEWARQSPERVLTIYTWNSGEFAPYYLADDET